VREVAGREAWLQAHFVQFNVFVYHWESIQIMEKKSEEHFRIPKRSELLLDVQAVFLVSLNK